MELAHIVLGDSINISSIQIMEQVYHLSINNDFRLNYNGSSMGCNGRTLIEL